MQCVHLSHTLISSLFFKDYGRTFGKGDTVGCFLDLESEPIVISFTVNGQHQGIAYEVSHSDLGDQALFPHIVTKNTSFRVSFYSFNTSSGARVFILESSESAILQLAAYTGSNIQWAPQVHDLKLHLPKYEGVKTGTSIKSTLLPKSTWTAVFISLM